MSLHLIDTSILVDVLRAYEPARTWIDRLGEADRAISVAISNLAIEWFRKHHLASASGSSNFCPH